MKNPDVTEQPEAPTPVACSDLLGAMYRGSDGAMTCALCHCEMEWVECQAGCDDGYFDGYEDDPNWYQPGEMKQCGECCGHGGSYWCDTKDCKTATGCKIIEAPKAPNEKLTDAGPDAPGLA